MTTLIIGFGNPLRGDDSIGLRAAQALEERLVGADVEIIACQQLTLELSEQVSRAALAIFIDADMDGDAGAIHVERLRPKAPDVALTHHLTPAALLACAHELYGSAPSAVQFTVTGKLFGLTERLSPPVARALPRLVEAVARVACPQAEPS
jgi:hydrogenase maturation protease